MSSSSQALRSIRRRFSWLREPSLRLFGSSSILAICIVVVYVAATMAAYDSTLQPPNLSLRIGMCGNAPCVTWVMPAGLAYLQGARPGMAALSADGRSLSVAHLAETPLDVARNADLQGPSGHVLHVETRLRPIGQSPMKYSLWVLGWLFALLGAAVVLRRPDLHAARMFGLFAGVTALALAMGPSAGGPAPSWALVIQSLAVLGVGTTFLPFIFAMIGDSSEARMSIFTVIFLVVSGIIAFGYGVSVSFTPSLYDLVRPAIFLYFSVSIFGAVGALFLKSNRERSPAQRQQARIAFWGIALGTLPFVGLTLIPEVLRREALLPSYLTILAWGLLPASFAYAILQYQLLGIRRLVHRGMVYGLTTFALLALIALALASALPFFGEAAGVKYSAILIAAVLVGGILLFFPLRHGARWLVDSLLYKDAIDYQTFLDVVHEQLLASNRTSTVAAGIAQRVAQALRLESVLLFLGPDASRSHLVAKAGDRADDVLRTIYPKLEPSIADLSSGEVVQLHWESDALLLANLKLSGRFVGYMLVGPKRAGDIFLDEEKRLVATMAPMLALGIDKSELAEELRVLNQRLVKAEEGERGRIAADLHDGPLQKALLLAGAFGTRTEDPDGIARQLVSDLREICSRLRPAILDDLGLVPALEWLVDRMSRQSGLSICLHLDHMTEDDRFPPEIELSLFRVTQEAINNAVKHAKGTSLDISLSKVGDSLVLQVTDNGVGFPVASRRAGGFGLSGMRERVVQVNGSLDIQSVPGLGTTVTVRVPLPAQSIRSAIGG